jgi:hypothetical protein
MCSTNGPQCFSLPPLLYLALLIVSNCTTLYIRADLANAVSLTSSVIAVMNTIFTGEVLSDVMSISRMTFDIHLAEDSLNRCKVAAEYGVLSSLHAE